MSSDARDAHLHAALRHAPDAGLEAPAALSARIRAAAHAAVRPAPWWQRWRAEPPWRLGASGAFATFALAGVIGLLWQGEPPPVQAPEPLPAPDAPASSTPPAADAPAVAAEVRAKAAVPAATPTPPVARRERAPAGADRAAPPSPTEPPADPVLPAPPPRAAPAAVAADAPVAKEAAPATPAAAPAPPPLQAMTGAPERARALGLAATPGGAWLADLERTVAGGWRAETGEPPPLRRLGAVGIAFDGDRVWRCDGDAPRVCRSAPLPAHAAQRLREALDALR